jgi:hypothetical protein
MPVDPTQNIPSAVPQTNKIDLGFGLNAPSGGIQPITAEETQFNFIKNGQQSNLGSDFMSQVAPNNAYQLAVPKTGATPTATTTTDTSNGSWLGNAVNGIKDLFTGNQNLTPTLQQQGLIDSAYKNSLEFNPLGSDGYKTKADFSKQWLTENQSNSGMTGGDFLNGLNGLAQTGIGLYGVLENIDLMNKEFALNERKYNDSKESYDNRITNQKAHAQAGIDAYAASKKADV